MACRALSKLDEEITCPVCLGTYSEPKILQCLHVYCKKCLEKFFPVDSTPSAAHLPLICPQCRQPTPFPDEGVSGLKTAFHILHLIEIKDSFGVEVLATGGGAKGEGVVSVQTCSGHQGQEVSLYCASCEVPICTRCTVKGGTHCGHDFELIEEVFERDAKTLADALASVESHLLVIENVEKHLTEHCEKISHKSTVTRTEIEAALEKWHGLVEEKGKQLIGSLCHMTENKLAGLAKERELLNISKTKLKSCESIVKNALKTNSPGRVITIKDKLVKLIEDVVADLSFKPGSEDFSLIDTSSGQPMETASCLQREIKYSEIQFSSIKDPCFAVANVVTSSSPDFIAPEKA